MAEQGFTAVDNFQQKVFLRVVERIQAIDTASEFTNTYKAGYVYATNKVLEFTDAGTGKYSTISKAFIPVNFADVSSQFEPIPNIEAETATVSVELFVDVRKLSEITKIIHDFIKQTTGFSEVIDGKNVAFNVSNISPVGANITHEGEDYVIIGFTLFYLTSNDKATIGGAITVSISGTVLQLLSATFTSAKSVESAQAINNTKSTHEFREADFSMAISAILPINDTIFNDLISRVMNPSTQETSLAVVITYPGGAVFNKTMIVKDGSINSIKGSFVIIALTLNEATNGGV